jgi:general secretion pathway protein D
VLLITPRIVRNLATPESSRVLLPAGTESVVGARPLTIGPTAPGSMSVRGGDSNPRDKSRQQRVDVATPPPPPPPEPPAAAPADTPAAPPEK